MSRKIPNFDTESSKLAFLREYADKVESMLAEYPNLRFARSLEEMEVFIKESPWSRVDGAEAFHWSTQTFQSMTSRWKVPYIYVNNDMRTLFHPYFERLPPRSRRANIYYCPEDLAKAYAKNATCTVTSVLVPLTMLSDQPVNLRSAFLAEKERRFHSGAPLNTSNYANRLSTWNCMEYVKPEFRSKVGCWIKTLRYKMAEQGTNRSGMAKFVPVPVTLTADCLPKFYMYSELSVKAGYTGNSAHGKKVAQLLGMAEVKINEETDKVLYTYGPRVGTEADAICYEIGLLDLWTAEQFVEVFGHKALDTGKWLTPKGEASWSAPNFSFGAEINQLELKTLLAYDFKTGIPKTFL